MSTSISYGASSKIQNPTFETKGNHATAAKLKGWKIVGDKNQIRSWNVGGNVGSVLSIAKGVSVTGKVVMPQLSDQEKKVGGNWNGLLILDNYGADITSKNVVIKYGVEIIQKEKTLLKKVITVRASKAKMGVDKKQTMTPSRDWIILDPSIVKAMLAAPFKVKLTGLSDQALILGGIEITRVHEKPTRKLENKPNGRSGPDRVNVGSLGFNLLVENNQRVSTVYDVRKGGAGQVAGLQDGDILVGINKKPLSINRANPGWKWFKQGHAATLGNAILKGLSGTQPSKELTLNLFRNGQKKVITVKLPPVYLSKDFYLKAGGQQMRGDMIQYLIKRQKKDGSFGCPIRTTFAALSLLSEHDQKYAEPIFKAVNWMLNKYPNAENFGNLGYWYCSYAGILYCEYYLATGDTRVIPRIQAIHDWVMTGVHTSKWGMACLGHGPSGLPYGNKALMAPTSHLLVFDGLAQKCGVESQLWETLLPYMIHCWSDPAKKGGHGSMGYNASYKDKQQFWSRTGQSALACAIRGEQKNMQDAMTEFMANKYPFYRNSHAYGEPGGAWGIISLAYARPEAYKKVMNALRWDFALSWELGYGMRFSQPHMGAPYMGEDDLVNAAYVLVFNAHKKSLAITGAGADKTHWLDVSALRIPVKEVILRRQKLDGKIVLESRIPGNQIFFTTDGSKPSKSNKNTQLYQHPFSLDDAGVVKAVCMRGTQKSKITKRNYPKFVKGLRVVAASGHKDKKEAIRRANYSIDGARYYAWIPDVGQGTKHYPQYVIYDLGALAKVRKIQFVQGLKNGGVGACIVTAGTNLEALKISSSKEAVLAEEKWAAFSNVRDILISKENEVRFVRIDFPTALGSQKTRFKLEELRFEFDSIRPLPVKTTIKAEPDGNKQSSPTDINEDEEELENRAGNTWVHYSVLAGLILLTVVVYLKKK